MNESINQSINQSNTGNINQIPVTPIIPPIHPSMLICGEIEVLTNGKQLQPCYSQKSYRRQINIDGWMGGMIGVTGI
jgi:hypothetical protein